MRSTRFLLVIVLLGALAAFALPSLASAGTTLSVTKQLVPSNDNGIFDLFIDSRDVAQFVSNGGGSAPINVTAGSHTIREVVDSNATLKDYNASYACYYGATLVASGSTAPFTVNVASGHAVSCTITNVRRPTLKLVLSVPQDDDNGYFNLFVNATQVGTNARDTFFSNALRVDPGVNAFSEAAGTATDLSKYAKSASCTSNLNASLASTGTNPWSVSLAAGENAVCTVVDTSVSEAQANATYRAYRVTRTLVFDVWNDQSGSAHGTLHYSDANGLSYDVQVACVAFSSYDVYIGGLVQSANFGLPYAPTYFYGKAHDGDHPGPSPDYVWGSFYSASQCPTAGFGSTNPADGPFTVNSGDVSVFRP